MGGEKMMKSEYSMSCDAGLGQVCSAKMNRSLSNLPSIKIDEVDTDDEEDMGCNNVPRRSAGSRSSYKSVLPRKLGRFRTQQVSQVSPQSSCERLTVGRERSREKERVHGRERERRAKVYSEREGGERGGERRGEREGQREKRGEGERERERESEREKRRERAH